MGLMLSSNSVPGEWLDQHEDPVLLDCAEILDDVIGAGEQQSGGI